MNLYKSLRQLSSNTLPRRIHCYCLGAAKTATTTVSAMFESAYDSRHEADIETTNHTIIRYLKREISDTELRVFLRNRDRQLRLELESTHSLIYVSRQLASLFPEARFLLTIREPMSWLRSRLNFHFKKHPPEWEEYRNYFWMKNLDYFMPEEELLREHGLAPLHVYLKQYAEHYELAARYIPQDRCLTLRTDEISNGCTKIAKFLDISPRTIDVTQSNMEPNKAAFIDQLDEQFVVQAIWEHTESIIEKYFPERLPFYAKYTDNSRV